MVRLLDPLLGPKGYEYRQNFGTELRHWNAKLAAVKNGTGKARVLVIGDSVFEGYGATTTANRPMTKFAAAIQQIWRPGGEGYVPTVQGTGMTLPNRWTLAGTPDFTDYGYGVGRRSVFLNTVDDTATITFTGDRFQLWYTQASSTANMKITVDGGTPILFNTSNATLRCSRVWDSVTNGGLTLARGSHTVVVQADNTGSPATYSVILDGIMIFDLDFTVGVQVINASRSGYSTVHYYNSTLSNISNTGFTGMDNVQPDLVVIELGLNDLGNGVPVATMKTNLVGVVHNVLTNGTLNSALGYTPSIVLVPLWGRADGIVNSATGSITAGSNVLTDLTQNFVNGYSVSPGALVVGTNIPAGTHVTGFTDAHHLTMSANATGVGVQTITYSVTFQDEQWTPYRVAIYEVARDNGYLVWDMYNNAGGYIGTDPDGLTVDKLHCSDIGAQLIATAMTRQFTDVPDQFWVPRGIVNALGDTFVGNADNSVVRLPAGLVDGQVLTTRAIAQNPDGVAVGVEWVDPMSSGTIVQIKKDPGAATVTAIGTATPTLTATASSADDALGPWLNSATTAVSGNASGIISAFTVVRRDWLFEYVTRIRTDPTAITTIRYWIGLFSASPDASATPAVHLAAFRYDTLADATAFWRAVVDNGSGAPSVIVTTAAIAANTDYILRIAATATQVMFYVNSLLVATQPATAKLPTSSTLLGYGNRVTTLVAGARNLKTSRIGLSYV